ncbi:hypothetical protein ACFL1B_03405 [Nanoarchaeota archaeon]
MDRSERLIKYGFIKKNAKRKYMFKEDRGYWIPRNLERGYDKDDADEEFYEAGTVLPYYEGKNQYSTSGYPSTMKTYRLLYKSPTASMEESYYWLMDTLRIDHGFPEFDKIMDIFSASEQSAFWGQAWSRLGIQQDRATQYLATIGKMVKDLFQIVREIRILEERLEIYEKAPKSKSADVTLKGLYIDLVEGGSKNPSSVYGIAQQVGFTVLPDLYFNTHVYDVGELDRKINDMKWNEQVKNIFRRKMYSYLNWKEKTEYELKSRFKFTVKYLRQHWGVIKMYMNWVKPYLRNVQRLQMRDSQLRDAHLISAFESSLTEIEVLAKRALDKGVHPCILISIHYVTQPELSYHQEGYQHKGPIHTGEVEFFLRAYAWTPEEVENFRKMNDDEDMDLIKLIDESVAAAMEALSEDLNRYLDEANETLHKYGIFDDDKKKEKKEQAKRALGEAFDPFISLFKGFGEIGGIFFHPSGLKGKGGKKKISVSDSHRKKIIKGIQKPLWLAYKNYKKRHGMLSW